MSRRRTIYREQAWDDAYVRFTNDATTFSAVTSTAFSPLMVEEPDTEAKEPKSVGKTALKAYYCRRCKKNHTRVAGCQK